MGERAGRQRDRATVMREIAEVERYLVDVPPHAAGGHRDALAATLAELRRELGRIDAERRAGDDGTLSRPRRGEHRP